MVRSIERVLRAKVKRCTLNGFDYQKAAPSRDTEFARPPRQSQRRSGPKKTEAFKASSPGPQVCGHR